MGYTRYWGFGKDVDMKAYKSALKDIGTMVKANTDILADGGGEGEPIVKANEIVFNGKAENGEDHETFALASKPKGDFCKTARKPYDEFVGASLLILKDYLGDQVDIDSDGSEGDDGKAMAKKYSKAKPDLKLVKNESHNPNRDFALINECVSSIISESTELGFARNAFNSAKGKKQLTEATDYKGYYKSELARLGNIDEYGATVVIHADGKKTKFLSVNKDMLIVFNEWAKKQGLDKKTDSVDESKKVSSKKVLTEGAYNELMADEFAKLYQQLKLKIESPNQDVEALLALFKLVVRFISKQNSTQAVASAKEFLAKVKEFEI